MNKELLIFGGSSTALEIYEAALLDQRNSFDSITYVVGDHEEMNGKQNAISDSELNDYIKGRDITYIISFTNQKLRLKMVEAMDAIGLHPTNVIHPHSIISSDSNLGVGNYIAAGAKLSVNSIIGNHCLVNFDCTVGHDAVLGDHVVLNPGVRISGNVQVGSRVLIGSNSIIMQGKKVHDDVLIDALTYINRDIENNRICSSSRGLKQFKRVL